MNIIIADDDDNLRIVLETALKQWGYNVISCHNMSTLLECISNNEGHVLLSDVLMPDGNGLTMLPHIKTIRPELHIIIMSARIDLLTTVQAEHEGAFAFLPKPFDLEQLRHYITSCLDDYVFSPSQASTIYSNASNNTNNNATSYLTTPNIHDKYYINGTSPKMAEIFQRIARLSHTDLSVIIQGESGTGKELIAHALHQYSPRNNAPFVAINMASIPKNLIESELFGHEKGAFTGAYNTKKGKFADAEGGTLFLDEIGDMPLAAQTRLLRVLQEGEYTPVGSNQSYRTNSRIIAATHRNLNELIQQQLFRADLFFRLYGASINVPPLRERKEDIDELVTFFNNKASKKNIPIKHYQPDALAILQQYNWPGNVRELEQTIYRINALMPAHHIHAADIEQELTLQQHLLVDTPSLSASITHILNSQQPTTDFYKKIQTDCEHIIMNHALEHCHFNKVKAAELLGMNRNTLTKKYNQHHAKT